MSGDDNRHTTQNAISHTEREIQLKLAFEKELSLFPIKGKKETIQHESGNELLSEDTHSGNLLNSHNPKSRCSPRHGRKASEMKADLKVLQCFQRINCDGHRGRKKN